MITMTYSREAEDKRRGMTVGEVRAVLDGVLLPDDARIIVRVGGRGQVKSLRVEVGGDGGG